MLPCIALGTATFVMQASESVIASAFNSSLLAYGGDIAVGAMTILSSVMQLAMLPPQGIAQGAQPILSYNYGAKNASRVKEVAASVPIDKLLVETDAPYLAPVPNRGKRNSSLNLPYIAGAIGEIWGVSPEEVAEITTKNGRQFFGI